MCHTKMILMYVMLKGPNMCHTKMVFMYVTLKEHQHVSYQKGLNVYDIKRALICIALKGS